ncbi:Proteasome activator PA28 like protein [Aduncisulcus paluster]|uniref:Proteasome activator PA28 like protein n=1 Tax=Aduncisulcus paluster TaxID=2918883 RepID=A0ABQ5KRT5_9EUKA|nr:Proteasome activator PA28 like protein [Aduncisulcus paluster]
MEEQSSLVKQAKFYRKQVKALHEDIYKKAYHSMKVGLPQAVLDLESLMKENFLLQEGFAQRYALELKRIILAGWIDEKSLDQLEKDLPPLTIPIPIASKELLSTKIGDKTIKDITLSKPRSIPTSDSEKVLIATKEDISIAHLPQASQDMLESWRVALLKDVTKPIVALYDELKEKVVKMVDIINSMKMMLQLRLPKMEGGEDFSISVQTGFLSELASAEDAILLLKREALQYHLSRGKLVAKLEKMPTIRDMYMVIISFEEKKLEEFRSNVSEIKNLLLIMFDQLTKNEEFILKVHKPKRILGM